VEIDFKEKNVGPHINQPLVLAPGTGNVKRI
jgi:hypothetical protein